MAAKFGSGCKTAQNVSQKSAQNVRGCGGTLVYIVRVNYVDEEDDVNMVGQYAKSKNLLTAFGNNEGFNSTPRDILEYKKRLFVCGAFTFVGELPLRPLNGVAVYDNETGDWEQVDGTDLQNDGDNMVIWNDILVILGNFSSVNSVADTFRVAFLSGKTWVTSNSEQTQQFLPNSGTMSTPQYGADYKNELYVSNQGFNQYKLNRYDAPNWTGLLVTKNNGATHSIPGPYIEKIYFMTPHNGFLYIGGEAINGASQPKTIIYEYDGVNYNIIADDITTATSRADTFRTTVYKGNLVICGDFVDIDGLQARHVAQYDSKLLTWSEVGDGFNDECFDVHVNNGKLYAIGSFTENGTGDTVNKMGVFNPVGNKWNELANRLDVTSIDLISKTNSNFATFKGKLNFQPETP